MKIEYLGHACFRLTNKEGVSLIIDPYTKVGYELSQRYKADVALLSHAHYDHAYIEGVEVEEVIKTVKKCKIKGVEITGIESFHDEKQGTLRGKNIIFKINIDGVLVTHLGDLGERCTDETSKKIGKTDILLIPVGGTYTIDAYEAKKYVEKLSPKIVIPMHYKQSQDGIDVASAEEFLSLFSKEVVYFSGCEIKIEEERLTKECTEIIYMERKTL